ncbi:MAG: trypsin-like peptidase domain-containing protein [bacterium]
MNSNKSLLRWSAGLIVVGLVGVAVSSMMVTDAQKPVGTTMTPQEHTTVTALESAFIKLSADLAPCVVHIRVTKHLTAREGDPYGMVPPEFRGMFPSVPQNPQTVRGQGSGVVIRSDGYILTNDHVVADTDEVEVEFNDGRKATGTVMRDYASDIAIVKVDRKGLRAATLGDSDAVKTGQFAIAMGSPFGLSNTVTVGHISAIKRQEAIGSRSEGVRFYPNLIQTDAPINPGNSGGPLVNIDGEVIGINTAIESGSGGSVGIGFAIPINTAKSIVQQLIDHGKVTRGFLGIGPKDLTPEQRESMGIQKGVMVGSVRDSSPGDKAGLVPGDVITEFNGTPVDSELALRELIWKQTPGSTVVIKVIRNGKAEALKATLTEPPATNASTPSGNSPEENQPATKLGVRVQPLTDSMIERYKLRTGLKGVVVTQVAPGSPADDAGISDGDVIIEVDRVKSDSSQTLNSILAKAKAGQVLRVLIWRRFEDGTGSQNLVSVKLR